jgi:hypothetical protein
MIARVEHPHLAENTVASFLDTTHIHRFRGSYDPRPIEILTLRQALETIRGDTYQYQIECLRQTLTTHGKGLYDHYKKTLDANTFGGTFTPTRAKEHLTHHSGLVHLDYDNIPTLTQTRGVLCVVPTITYMFISPSGRGLKIGVRVPAVANDGAYKHAWQHVADTFQQTYGLVADPTGKDISRLCYVSWDPECYVNPDPDVYPLPLMEVPPPRPPAPAIHSMGPTSDRRQQYVGQAVARAVKLIESSYPATPEIPGTRHDARLKAARLLGGYIGGGLMTYDDAYSVLQTAVIDHTVHLTQSMKTIDAGLRYGMNTPVTYEQLEQERLAWCAASGYTPRQGGRH